MRNSEIISAIYQRDKSQELTRNVIAYNERIKRGHRSLIGFENYADIFSLLCKLRDSQYQITTNDAVILRKYNVLVSPHNASNYTKINGKSFVVISDFHSIDYPLEKTKNHYLKEYDTIYILGDATDRGKDGIGTGGIKILLEIMNLSKKYPGRVIYVPGNHDEFLIGYTRQKYNLDNYYYLNYAANLVYNGGEATAKELNRLERENPQLFNELISWLGKQPLQRVHQYKGKEYVLGHAQFNQKLYNINPNYCLEDYFKESQYSDNRRIAKDILWFRKDRDRYNPSEIPSSDKIMVIGHTIEKQSRGKNIDLIDPTGKPIKVYCVDGGIAYDGGMLKYDGKDKVLWSNPIYHNDTSDKNETTPTINDPEIVYQDYILDKVFKEGKLGIHQLVKGNIPNELSQTECDEIIYRKYGKDPNIDIKYMKSIYVKTFLFDYIIECQLDRMIQKYQDYDTAITASSTLIDLFLNGSNDPNYINKYGNSKGNYHTFTSNRSARYIAMVLGEEVIRDILKIYRCNSIYEYMNLKFPKNNSQLKQSSNK